MGQYSNRVIADGASHYWRLGEASGTTAVASVGGANGTISGGVTLGQAGAIADGTSAMAFNGTTGKVQMAGPVTLPLTCTIEAWVKKSLLAGDYTIFSTRGLGTGDTVVLYLANGIPAYYATLGGGSGILRVDDGQWHHLIYVLTPTTGSVYVDGVLSRTEAFSRSTPSVGGASMAWDQPNPQWFPGALDDVAIYPRALTAAEISAHYAIGRTTEVSALGVYAERVISDGASNYWRLNESSGTTAIDIVSAKNGTISGGVTLGQPSPLGDGTSAMLFNGTTGAITPPPLTVTPLFSIEGWLKVAAGVTGQRVVLFLQQDGATYVLAGVSTSGALISYSGATGRTGVRDIRDGQWHHVAYVYGTPGIKLYVDGVLDTDALNVVIPAGFTSTLFTRLGSSNTVEFFQGALDEVAIYPRALSASEVAAHYALSTVPVPRDLNTGLYTYLVGVFGLSSATSYAERVRADGATNHWRLGETSGTTAVDAIGGANGTISGGVTLNQPSALADGDKAMLFPGTDTAKITTTLSGVMNGAAAMTWEAWVRLDSLAAPPNGFRMAADLGDNLSYLGFNGSVFYCALSVGGVQKVVTGGPVNLLWHHLALTYDGTAVRLYVDGGTPSVTAATGTVTNAAGGFQIGNWRNVAGYGWLGAVDDVSIYPVALTAQQVAAHSSLGRSGFSGGNDLTTLITRYLATLTGDYTARWKQMEKNAGF